MKQLNILLAFCLLLLGNFSIAQNNCATPTGVIASSTPNNPPGMALISWTTTGYPTGTTYSVEYKLSQQTTWTVVTATSSPVTIAGLAPCSEYQVRIKAFCTPGSTASSAYSIVVAFASNGCSANCPAPVVSLTPIASNTGTPVIYGIVVNLTPPTYPAGTAYLVEYKKTNATSWISTTTTSVPYTINGLDACSEYMVRVKAYCSTTTASTYSASIVATTGGCPPSCVAPFIVSAVADSLNGTKGTIWFTSNNPVQTTTYTVEYKLPSATNFTVATTNATGSTYTLTGLTACTDYHVRVKANCSSTSSSGYSNIIIFKTSGCVIPCEAPVLTNIYSVAAPAGATGYVATLTWNASTYPAGTYYIIEYKKNTATTWTLFTATSSPASISGLSGCTEYQFRIKAFCPNSNGSGYSNQMAILTAGCAAPCATPQVTTAADSISTKGKVTFSSTGYAAGTTFSIEYKLPSAATWTVVTVTSSPYYLTGLTPCTEYQVRLKANCSSTTSSAYSNTSVFKTSGCPATCNPPIITASPSPNPVPGSTGYAAVINWNAASYSAGTVFIIEYKKNTATTWSLYTANTSPTTIGGLDACSEYQFRMKAICPNTNGSGYSTQVAIQTGGCPAPCSAPQVSAYADSSATVGTVYFSLNNAVGTTYTIEYKFPSATTWTVATTSATTSPYYITGLTPCKEYLVRVKANCSATSSSAYSNTAAFMTFGCPSACNPPVLTATAIPNTVSGTTSYGAILSWITSGYPAGTTYVIEYKKNTATTWNTFTTSSSPFTIAGLDACSEYQFRVKAICSNTSMSLNSNQVAIQTGGCNAGCAAPFIQAYVNPVISAISGTVAWNSTSYPAGTTFVIEYKLPSATTWTTATTSATSSPYTISTGLALCTEYQVRVKALCNGVASNYSNISGFKTVGCPPCPVPTQLTITNITNTTAIATWASVSGAASYTIQYKSATIPNAPWITTTSTTNSIAIIGLTKCRYYIVKVRSNCTLNGTSTSSAYSTTKTFKTTGCLLPANKGEQSLVISPNPSSTSVTISYLVENEGRIKIDIVNMNGTLIKTLSNEVVSGGFYQNTFDDISDIESGIYFIVISAEDGEKIVSKWAKF